MLGRKTTNMILRSLTNLEYGKFEIELPNGKSYRFAGSKPGPEAHLRLHDLKVLSNMALRGNIALANDYRLGKWESDDIAALVEWGLINYEQLGQYIYGSRTMHFLSRLFYLFAQNTRKGSLKNSHYHYDLGNNFFELWLDSTMTYSSAIFKSDEDDLTTAQHQKYDRILGRLGDSPRHLLDIGCGWGGFAERSAEKADHKITGITVSASQCEYANRRLQDKRPQVNIQIEDYRDTRGKFDAIVSIEMFEAVGERYWKTFFDKIKSLLEPKGKAIIQTITIEDAYFEEYKRTGDAIRSYIFPGGMLPSPGRFKQETERAGLKITDQYFFGQDYARTMKHWLNRFETQSEAIRLQNFDEPFMRLWRFYLASCIGAFSVGGIDVMQVELHHA